MLNYKTSETGMGRNMLEHQKKVIENVSNNNEIVKKEIYKSRKWLTENEFEKLQEWLKSHLVESN